LKEEDLITQKDQIFCACIAVVLTICLKWFIYTESIAGGIFSTAIGYYFWRIYDSYCWGRAMQETLKK